MLRRGARRVIALDVGYGQLALRLRNDPRVVVKERVNIRHVVADDLEYRQIINWMPNVLRPGAG